MKNLVFLFLLVGIVSCKNEPKATENKIKEDVAFLADDKLEGRQTGTQGEILASEYIVKRFKAIDLQPKGTKDYIQSFSFKPKTDPHSEVEFTTNACYQSHHDHGRGTGGAGDHTRATAKNRGQ